ncbi:MAG: hypothetical protein OEY41_09155 [Acidimicrobiia bacterium]|nr:hypothetical protein [Acidimicrobiia bacterium]
MNNDQAGPAGAYSRTVTDSAVDSARPALRSRRVGDLTVLVALLIGAAAARPLAAGALDVAAEQS